MNDTQRNQTSGVSASAAAIFVLVIIAVGVLVGRSVNLTPPIASEQAAQVDDLFNSLLGIASGIFLLVEGALVYAVIRYRRRPGHEGEGPSVHGDNQLELAWTIVPALIVFWLAVHSGQVLTRIRTTPPDAMPVRVVARQFSWEFEYPEYGIRSPDLHVPEGRSVALELNSMDVIHSFWVPAFRLKQDALPGRTTRTTFTASLPGTYPVVCAELCGVGHSIMHTQVVVHEAAEFDAWLEEAGG